MKNKMTWTFFFFLIAQNSKHLGSENQSKTGRSLGLEKEKKI
jgi:hypothetical protein